MDVLLSIESNQTKEEKDDTARVKENSDGIRQIR
jgi:hypothetical protein